VQSGRPEHRDQQPERHPCEQRYQVRPVPGQHVQEQQLADHRHALRSGGQAQRDDHQRVIGVEQFHWQRVDGESRRRIQDQHREQQLRGEQRHHRQRRRSECRGTPRHGRMRARLGYEQPDRWQSDERERDQGGSAERYVPADLGQRELRKQHSRCAGMRRRCHVPVPVIAVYRRTASVNGKVNASHATLQGAKGAGS